MQPSCAPVRWRRLLWSLAGVAVLTAGCALAGSPGKATDPAAAPARLSIAAPPAWRPGDQWVYAWTSGRDSGVKVVEFVEERQIGTQSYYVVRVGDLDHLYTPDLGWAASLRGNRVDSRMTPPQPWFTWPLEPGRRWTHRGVFEDAKGRHQNDDRFTAAGQETVEVPAGRFLAMKVVREAGSSTTDEYWYAPDVRFYVRWIGRRGDIQFEERLQSYRSSSGAIPPPGSPTGPPSTR